MIKNEKDQHAWFIIFSYPHPDDNEIEVTINLQTNATTKEEAIKLSKFFYNVNPDQYVFRGKVPK